MCPPPTHPPTPISMKISFQRCCRSYRKGFNALQLEQGLNLPSLQPQCFQSTSCPTFPKLPEESPFKASRQITLVAQASTDEEVLRTGYDRNRMKNSQIQKLLVTVNEIMLPTSGSCWGLQETYSD